MFHQMYATSEQVEASSCENGSQGFPQARNALPQQKGKRKEENAKVAQALGAPKKGRPAFGDITNAGEAARYGGPSQQEVPRLAAEYEHSQQQRSDVDERATIRYHWSTGSSIQTEPQKAKTQLQWINIDSADADNPMACTDYVESIMDHLYQAERRRRPLVGYINNVQNDMQPSMRSILVDWLVEVSLEFKLVSDTLFLGVSCIDRFLSVHPIPRQQLQLVGVTCMLLASKYEEIYAPTGDEYSYITDNTYTKREILRMEELIWGALNFELTVPTSRTFLRRFLKASAADWANNNHVWRVQSEFLAAYVLELSLPEYSALAWLPSMTAAAAVLLARYTCTADVPVLRGLLAWNPTLEHYCGYRASELRECVTALHEFHLKAHRRGSREQSAIHEKYSQQKYHSVSTILPPPDSLPAYLFEDLESPMDL